MKILASGPSGAPSELDPLRAAGHEVVIGRPLDQQGRAAYTETDLGAAARDCHVVLASHLDWITAGVMEAAASLRLVIVPFIGTDKIDVPAASRLGVLVANSPRTTSFGSSRANQRTSTSETAIAVASLRPRPIGSLT